MITTSLLSEEDRQSLTNFYRYTIIWKHVLVVIVAGFCLMLLSMVFVDGTYMLLWFIIGLLIYGWFSFKATQKQLVNYEIDIQENIKARVAGIIVGLVFEEAGQYITFCADNQAENEIFLLSYKNDKQIGKVNVGDRVELEYTPYCRFLLRIQRL